MSRDMSEQLEVLFPGGKRVHVRIRDFEIATDQSLKDGGDASAPAPFDLFLASMAACAGIYALNFCQSRKLPTTGLGLDMLWERDDKRHIKAIKARARLRLRLPEGFPPKYREGILRAMDLCAVKKQIENAPELTTEILD